MRTSRLMMAAAALACLTVAPASAQPTDKRTIFTFSGPVAMPGVTLPAGQYLFRLPSSENGRVVQVLSADGTKPYGLFFALPAERPTPAPSPEVRFMETASDMPAAIKTWWYPGDRRGFEFVYPREQARRLAQGARQAVLTTQTPTTTTPETHTEGLSRLSSSGETQVDADQAPAAADPQGAAQSGALASAELTIDAPVIPPLLPTPTPPESTALAQSGRTSLPQTASGAPLTALAGTLALMAAALCRWYRPL